MDRLIVAASHYDRSMFEVMKHVDKIDLKINKGTQGKLQNFVTMIESFQVLNEGYDAFQIAEHVTKKTGLVQELKKDGTPEGIARIENIEELLNGMRDFVEEQKELADTTGSLAEFLEDVALATDLDNEKGDENRVALMTVHLAKGLEFPYVYIVGLEEDLFPSAMSMSTRSELEEERRLFYVALTRAEKQAYLTYTQSRYRWGKLIDAEPSRFIEEIEEQFLEYLTPITENRFKPLIDTDIFGEVDKSKLRLRKPIAGAPPKGPTETQLRKLRRLKPVSSDTDKNFDPAKANLSEGTQVEHVRFGKGKILSIEGAGADTKAEILFENGGLKKLLLRFAKLNVLDS
jgi:DNA helicase-2/ATP-dependent DNA helicase PcrA